MLIHRKKKRMIRVTPKGEFALFMIENGFAPETDGGYDMSDILSAWEDGKMAFAKAVCSNEKMQARLPHTYDPDGNIETTNVRILMRALEDAFHEDFTNFGSEPRLK